MRQQNSYLCTPPLVVRNKCNRPENKLPLASLFGAPASLELEHGSSTRTDPRADRSSTAAGWRLPATPPARRAWWRAGQDHTTSLSAGWSCAGQDHKASLSAGWND